MRKEARKVRLALEIYLSRTLDASLKNITHALPLWMIGISQTLCEKGDKKEETHAKSMHAANSRRVLEKNVTHMHHRESQDYTGKENK